MQVESFLERNARELPDKTALICGERRLSYREVDESANRLAHALLAGGVARGDRVAVYLENSVEAVVSIFAILKAGAVFLVVSPSTKADKLCYILMNCRAKGLITDARRLAASGETLAGAGCLPAIWLTGGMGSMQKDTSGTSWSLADLDAVVRDTRLPAGAPPRPASTSTWRR